MERFSPLRWRRADSLLRFTLGQFARSRSYSEGKAAFRPSADQPTTWLYPHAVHVLHKGGMRGATSLTNSARPRPMFFQGLFPISD